MNNPYVGIEEYQHHYRATSRVNVLDLNLTTTSEIIIDKQVKIATLGSCFAQHVSHYLRSQNYGVLMAEPETPSEFSANYGNIYTSLQGLQLLQESLGERNPEDYAWLDTEGMWRDALRVNAPGVSFSKKEEVQIARKAHLALVRKVFTDASIIIFTLGLTETWISRLDGTAYPVAPGVVAGEYNNSKYTPINFSITEVMRHLTEFVQKIESINSGAKIIFTVSPVPLIATFEKRHVILSSMYSKSVLRVAVEEVLKIMPNCRYFHSLELITNNINQSRYFEDDFRNVTQSGIDYVMRNFEQTFIDSDKSKFTKISNEYSAHGHLAQIICDEDLLR